MRPEIVLALGPALLLHTIYLHSRTDLSLGWLDGWVATLAFHRAHHACAGTMGNFGGIFSVWDRLFGTSRAPSATVPTGLPDTARLPENLFAQLVLPVRRALLGRTP